MKWKKWLPAGIVALAGLCLVFSQVEPIELAAAFRQISPLWALAGFGLALVSYALKTLRFALFLKPDISPQRLFGVTLAQNVLAQVFPARAGDVGYVIMLRKMKMAGAGHGIVSLLASRIMDVVVLFGMYLWAVWRLDFEIDIFRRFAQLFAAMVLAALFLAFYTVLNRGGVARMINRICKRFNIGWLEELRRELDEVLASGSKIKLIRHVFAPLLLSVAIWGVSASWVYLVWRAVGADLEIAHLLFLVSLSQMLGLIPVFIFGGVGALDGINTLALVSFGLQSSDAAAFSLCNRAVSLIYLFLMTALALIFTRGGKVGTEPTGESTGISSGEAD